MSQNPASAITTAYRVEQLRFRYRSSSRRAWGEPSDWVLNALTFDVMPGEIFGIIGPNGSGKSSLLKVLAKVLRPQTGMVRLFGQDLAVMSQDAMARQVALVPQDFHPIFPFTVSEMVLMGRFPHHQDGHVLSGFRWERAEDIRLAEEAMRETDVVHLADRSIDKCSAGERQRVLLARALAQNPQVLLLDEPTAFLDLNHQLDICRILSRLNQQRELTVILVSHDLNLASQYCDRLMLLNGGAIVCLGSPQEVIRPPVLEAVYGCNVLVDHHPDTGLPRVTLPGRSATVQVDRV